MFKKIAETIIGGALGLAALYAVGRIAYQAGQEVTREECRYNAMRRANGKEHDITVSLSEAPEEATKSTAIIPTTVVNEYPPRKKQGKLGLFLGARKIFANRKSVLGNLVHDPEGHKFEAFVEGDELQIHVKRKEAS